MHNKSLAEAIAAVDRASTTQALIQATQKLIQLNDIHAAPKLMEIIGFNNPAPAAMAVTGITQLGPEVTTTIIRHLDAKNYGARAWAVRALAVLGDARGLNVLEHALASDIGPSVRRAAAIGLGDLKLSGDPDLAEQQQACCLNGLIQAAADGEWVVRYAVSAALEHRLQHANTEHDLFDLGRRTLERLSGDTEDVMVVRRRALLALLRLSPP